MTYPLSMYAESDLRSNRLRFEDPLPSNIGKYGGDIDNWMWPRHTGDFSMFRIYANKENKPADYSDENIPYKGIQAVQSLL